MGLLASRPRDRNEESDVIANQLYRFPAKSGNYFSNYFIMGGEKFDALKHEAYLFGDNMDLNFLGNRPVPFIYPLPQSSDPMRPLKCLFHIRKESVRFVRSNEKNKTSYNIEFIFDCDVRCSITIYYFCSEEITTSGVIYNSKYKNLTSEVYYYKRGANQHFVQPNHIFDPSLYSDEELIYNFDKDIIPVAIHCVALEGPDETKQSHTTLSLIERHADSSYSLKALKQKLIVDGLCYLLQEIYGIENKVNELNKEINDDEEEDGGLDCVICMSDLRDTLILPCKHLCLCQACADSLRYQANNCPICRSPFRALLHIKVFKKIITDPSIPVTEAIDGTPVGFKQTSLIEALNGPVLTKRIERRSRFLRKKTGYINESGHIKNENILNTLATQDTEDEDKSSSTIENLLCDKLLLISPTVHHLNDIINTEDEMPDEDSEAEKLSPLLDIGQNFCMKISENDLKRQEDKPENNNFNYNIAITCDLEGENNTKHSPDLLRCDKICKILQRIRKNNV